MPAPEEREVSGPMTDEQAPAATPPEPAPTELLRTEPPPGPPHGAPAPSIPPVASAATEPGRWGRADEDGTVWVRTADGERKVGQYPGVSQEEALGYFVRKFEDLAAQVKLL